MTRIWSALVTPLPSSLARPLVESLINEVIVTRPPPDALTDPPPLPFRCTVKLARAVWGVRPTTLRHVADFFFRRFANGFHFELEANRDAGERVVAIQYHVFRIDFRNRVELILRRIRIAAFGQALECHAFLEFRGE